MSNILFYKKYIYKRKKYLYNICLHIKEINGNIILFFDNSLEDIKKLHNLKRISIRKYLNSIYNFYCNKTTIDYQPIFKNEKIIDLNDDIIKILEKNYLLHPHFIKNEDDYYHLLKMVFNTGILLNMFERNPDPLISFTETNLLFIFLQILHLAEIYGLLFDVNLPIGLISFVFSYKIDKISLYINKLY